MLGGRDRYRFVCEKMSDVWTPREWFPDFLRYMAQMRQNPDDELKTIKPDVWPALRERMRVIRRVAAGQNPPNWQILDRFVPG